MPEDRIALLERRVEDLYNLADAQVKLTYALLRSLVALGGKDTAAEWLNRLPEMDPKETPNPRYADLVNGFRDQIKEIAREG